MNKNFKKLPLNSSNLKLDIYNFKNRFLNKPDYFICEQDLIVIKLSKKIIVLKNFIMLNFKKLSKNIIIKIYRQFKYKYKSKSNILSNFELINKKLDNQQILIERSFNLNSKLQKEIDIINEKLTNTNIFSSQNVNHDKTILTGYSSDTPNSKVDFYQEENLRLGSELVETKKKFEILKKEIDKYQDQRSKLISKINSVNDVINDSNVLTNIFDNNVNSKIEIIDHNKLEIKKESKVKADLNEKIKKIFLK